LFCLVIAMQHTAFALFVGRVFSFGSFETGIVMMVMGVVIVLNQMVLMRHVWLKRFSERDLERWMTLVMAVGFSLIATASLPLAMLGMFVHTLSQSVLRAVSASLIAGQVPDRHGEIMGVINTIMNLAMVVAAPLAGYLLDVGTSWPYLCGASLAAISYLLLRRRHEVTESPSFDATTSN
jgi:predicted MFS family arabinose efflux permease